MAHSAPIAQSALLEAIVRSATDYAIFTMDSSRLITSWSGGAQALFGWTSEEAIGQSGDVLFTPEDRERKAPDAEVSQAAMSGRAEDERWHVRKDGTRFWGSGVVVPLNDDAAEGFVKILRDRSAERRATLDLKNSEQHLRTLIEQIPQLVWRSRKLGDRSWGSPQWVAFTGLSLEQSVGFGWMNAIHPDDRNLTLGAWHEAELTGLLHVEHRVRRAADGEYRWFQTRATRLTDSDGQTVEWLGSSWDVHDLRRALERQKVLARELHHRTRNMLAVVGAISRRTLHKSRSLQEFDAKFSDRLAALARVQTLVASDENAEVDLGTLAHTSIAVHRPEEMDGVTIEGPPVRLTEKASETVALALHELATNAVKYGALAVPTGTLKIVWSTESGSLVLDWVESGVDLDGKHVGGGYGRELIEVALPFALGARTALEFGPDGVKCRVELPESEWTQGT